ncbi:MAG: TolC family protein, partial [Deltaproteobacteria bacterium]|nr:TolC family protein [Deltaproteobacteria bacterium]
MKTLSKNILRIVGVGFLCLHIFAGGVNISHAAAPTGSEKTIPAEEKRTTEKNQTALNLTLEEAIRMAFENNSLLRIERMNPEIQQTYENQEHALFDPVLKLEGDYSREKSQAGATTTTGPSSSGTRVEPPDLIMEGTDVQLQLTKPFSTGTEISAGVSTNRAWTNKPTKRYKTRIGLRVTQALLRNAGRDVNLAGLRQAELKTRMTFYELRGYSETLLAEMEAAYWNYALSLHQVKIVAESLSLAKQQQLETEEMITVGILAETEIVASQAEIALRRQYLIDIQSKSAVSRLRLLQLLNPKSLKSLKHDIILLSEPAIPEIKPGDVEAYVSTALRMRPDLNQARLDLERNMLEIIKTRNGLLPQMDLFISLGKTGYADSFRNSVDDIDGRRYDVTAGIDFEFPVRNRVAAARHQRARLSQTQAKEAINNLSRIVELDVRSAHIAIKRTEQQLSASKSTRMLQKEKLRIETEKFRVGRSTNFLVAQAQRDFMLSL